MFTTLDLSVLEFMPSSNVTALQLFKLNDTNIKRIKTLFDLKNMEHDKPLFKYLPVKNRQFVFSIILFTVDLSFLYVTVPNFGIVFLVLIDKGISL